MQPPWCNMRVCAFVCVFTNACLCACMHACVCVCVHSMVCLCVQEGLRANVCVFTRVRACVRACMCACVCLCACECGCSTVWKCVVCVRVSVCAIVHTCACMSILTHHSKHPYMQTPPHSIESNFFFLCILPTKPYSCIPKPHCNTLCNTIQHTATDTATHCNSLEHTATFDVFYQPSPEVVSKKPYIRSFVPWQLAFLGDCSTIIVDICY